MPSAPVFDAQSTSSDVHNRLSITFVAPASHCSVCDVDEAFSDGGSYTIFGVEGRSDGNLDSRVKLVGVKPVFMKYAVDRMHERRQVFLEVEALLDHLFRHINTPAHVAKRVMIPPFTFLHPICGGCLPGWSTTAKRILAVMAISERWQVRCTPKQGHLM